jgi:hypothetical protein
MDIAAILISKYPTSEWILDGENYEGLRWFSETQKPTKKQLEDLWEEVRAELEVKSQEKINSRSSALAKLAELGLTEAEIAAL